VGNGDACAITEKNALYCWGDNGLGQVSQAAEREVAIRPIRIDNADYRAVAVGKEHTCGVTTTDDVYCWGSNEKGRVQVGGTLNVAGYARPVDNIGDVLDAPDGRIIDASETHTCVLVDLGDASGAICWGSFQDDDRLEGDVIALGFDASEIAVGDDVSCALGNDGSDDRILCWGADHSTVLLPADCAGVECASPKDVLTSAFDYESDTVELHHLSVFSEHACVVRADDSNRLWCWGNNDHTRAWYGAEERPLEPYNTEFAATAVGAGYRHTCAVSASTDRATCWGNDTYGESGGASDGESATVLLPVDEAVVQISTGFQQSCAITESGRLFCWGRNEEGQLGDGQTNVGGSAPKEIPEPPPH
jgi:alpha-tubulin suppressor-like RCC1 family protein